MADATQATATQAPSAEDTPKTPLEWLKDKLHIPRETTPSGNKNEQAALDEEDSGQGKTDNQSSDKANGYNK